MDFRKIPLLLPIRRLNRLRGLLGKLLKRELSDSKCRSDIMGEAYFPDATTIGATCREGDNCL
jgi:hypothetical protein